MGVEWQNINWYNLLDVIGLEGIKNQVIRMIESLPEGVTLDDIMAELYFKLQVDKELKELGEGKGIPHEEVEAGFSKWLSK